MSKSGATKEGSNETLSLRALPRQKAVNYHFAVHGGRLAGRKKFNKCARPNTCPRAATFNMGRIDAKARACFQLWLGDSSARPLGISISVGKELVRRSAACVDGFRICKCPRRRGDQHMHIARAWHVWERIAYIYLSALPATLSLPLSAADNHAIICKSATRYKKKLLRSIFESRRWTAFSQGLCLFFVRIEEALKVKRTPNYCTF